MKSILFLLLVVLVTFVGCLKSTITSPNNNSNSTGKVSLKIDKTNAPQNVVSVFAYLTKADADTLIGTLNLRSDSTADISFQNISVGTWHLLVQADDSNGRTIYSGQSDVQVVDGTTTFVSLTLVPTSSGTGNIIVFVSWGKTQEMFTDYINNPVFATYDCPAFPKSVSQEKIFYDNGIYKMYYICGYSYRGGNVWYAESIDGINWTSKLNQPVLDKDSAGTWDDYAIAPGAILKDGDIYRLYYNGVRVSYGHHSVGLALSNDGINWTRYPTPVLTGDSSSQYYTFASSVLKINGKYYMYYWTSPITNFNESSINVATSTDGINWTKYSDNPILKVTFSWEGIGIAFPSVIYDNGIFKMIYTNREDDAKATQDSYGLAYSSDGLHWTKEYQTPIFTANQTVSKWAQIDYPCFIKVGNEYRLYYTGNPGNDIMNISFASGYNVK